MSKYRFIDNGGVASPAGFAAAGVTAGFKRSGAPDFAMIYSEQPSEVAGVFTPCNFAAAPVRLGRQRVRSGKKVHAVIVNSGNANACTGGEGMAAAEKSCAVAAAALGVKPEEVLCSSTGRIGVQLDMSLIEKGVALAVNALASGDEASACAAAAIMTTDTVAKSTAVEVDCGDGRTVRIGAMTKGAGMIDPHLVRAPHATMLCYITTDAVLEKSFMEELLSSGADNSFNRITVDGDMSTNDTALMFANGVSGVEISRDSALAQVFSEALLAVMQKLARMMATDGEGATKFVEVRIENAASEADAKKLAEAVGNSLLCKTAWFGGDPNWGRVAAALGYAGVDFDPDKVDIYFGSIIVMRKGGNAGTPESDLAETMAQKELTVTVDMGCGSASYWVWTCDVSYEYVKINADYHT